MKNLKNLLLCLSMMIAGSLAIVSCSDDDVADFAQVTIQGGEDPLELPRVSGEYTIDIKVDGEWYIDIEGKFAYVSQEDSCGTGSKEITLYTTTNRHEEDRDATLHVVSSKDKNKRESILLRQLGTERDPENADEAQTGNQIYAVGYGYDTSDCWASPKSVRAEILRTSDCLKQGIITTGPVDLAYKADVATGTSITELSNDLSVSAKVSGGGFGFKGEAEASFGMKDFSSNNYEYSIASVSVALKTAEAKKTVKTLRKSYMTPEAYQEINGLDSYGKPSANCDYPSNDEGFRELLNDYGTHLVMNAKLGGQVKYAMRIDVSKVKGSYDLNAYAKMSYSGMIDVSASVSDDLKKSYEDNKANCKITLNVLGGGKKESLALTEGDVSKNLDAWRQSLINGTNLALVDFSDNALIPLYELVDETKFPQRYEALKAFMTGERVRQIEAVKMEYQCGTVTMIDKIPDMEDTKTSTLIRDVYAGGQWVGRICSEYIPLIDANGRVTVVYPVFSGKVKYNMGYFIGDDSHRPAKVCWQGSSVNIAEDKEMPVGKLKGPFYFRGTSCSSESHDEKVPGVVREARAAAPGSSGTYKYGLVKIFDKIWMREYYQASTKEDGDLFGDNYNLKPLWGNAFGKQVGYYSLEMISSKAGAYYFAPSGWRVPYGSDYLNITKTLQDTGVQVSSYQAFLPDNQGGLLGFYYYNAGIMYADGSGYSNGNVAIISLDGKYDGVIDFNRETQTVSQHWWDITGCHMPVRLVQNIE